MQICHRQHYVYVAKKEQWIAFLHLDLFLKMVFEWLHFDNRQKPSEKVDSPYCLINLILIDLTQYDI